MDILSHAFWTAVAAKTANSKLRIIKDKKALKLKVAIFYGVIPDFFAFAPLFFSIVMGLLFGIGQIHLHNLPRPSEFEPSSPDTLAIFKITRTLYDVSHSIFVFAAVFLIIWLIFKKPKLEMLGWLFHILIDIPTHSYAFYPTPALWPFWNWRFNGLAWRGLTFLIINYSLMTFLLIVYCVRRSSKKSKCKNQNLKF